LTDGQLLARFAERHEPAALEALVGRHGPLVLRVCRQVLGDRHEAEDAFQTTFLVLVRKARGLLGCASQAGWLHTVARRLALRASLAAARRPAALPSEPAAPGVDPPTEASGREVCQALTEALHRLPGKYRAPLVLCYLKGKTHEEAARELAWPRGTVAGRLARARRLLGPRLKRLVADDAERGACAPRRKDGGGAHPEGYSPCRA
jgi:RNA polymerase sigma factor (sigma-70 family)